MSEKRLFNILKLAYSPVSNYDFAMVKDDALISQYINSGKIYMIVQRPVLFFQNLNFDLIDQINPALTFELHQRGIDQILECRLRLYQEKLGLDNDRELGIALNYTYPKPETLSNKPPFNHLANFVLKSENNEFIWFSPEKLLYHYFMNAVEADIKGEISLFTNYQVHYIGKATEQDVIKRLTGHSHLQEILSIEHPFHYGSLQTDEVAILFFDFDDNIFMNMITDENDDITEAVDLMMGKMPIDQKTIYLDAEKALINALKPKHNRMLYNKYPISEDGLNKYDLKVYTYSILDPITLKYPDGEIRGQSGEQPSDLIIIKDGKLSINKHSD